MCPEMENAPIQDVAPAAQESDSIESAPSQSSAPASSGSENSIESQTADLKQDIKNAVKDGASQQEIKQMIKEFELDVYGKSKKIKLDLSNDKEIKRYLQLAHAGQHAMQEKAELEKELTTALMEGRQDFEGFAKKYLQLDDKALDDWMEQRVARKVEEMKKSPEQKERERIERELADARAKLKKIEEDEKAAKEMRIQEQTTSSLKGEIQEAILSDKELPNTQKTMSKFIDIMLWAMKPKEEGGLGQPNIKAKDVVKAVKADLQKEYQEFFAEAPENVLEYYIGKQALDKARKARLAAAKQVPKTPEDVKPVSKPVDNSDKKGLKYRNTREAFKALEEKFKGK